jgi:hypothetical protein
VSSGYYWTLKLKKKGYDPGQPRVPAGDPRGGQWTAGGAGRGISGGKLPSQTEQRILASLESALEHGRSTGNEVAVNLDIDGNEIGREPGERARATLNPSPIVVHNHPENMTFALEDIAGMFRWQSIQHNFLITPDGTIYRLSRTDRTPINEWPGRVEKEYYVIDDKPEYRINDFQKRYEAEVGHPVSLNDVIFEKYHREVVEIARIMGLDYERYRP